MEEEGKNENRRRVAHPFLLHIVIYTYVPTWVMPTQPQDSVSITATAVNQGQRVDDEGTRQGSMKSKSMSQVTINFLCNLKQCWVLLLSVFAFPIVLVK